jgi:hypothetical protein
MKQLKRDTTTMVRIDKKIVAKVAKRKDKTGVSIGKFFEIAAEEKLKNEAK